MKDKKLHTSLIAVIYIFCLGTSLCSCSSPRKVGVDYLYFHDGPDSNTVQQAETVIQPNDLLTVQVYSNTSNQEQAAIFNLPSGPGSKGYQVNTTGDIQFPVIGLVKAQGLTLDQLQSVLLLKLANYVKNPSAVVHFAQFNVSVLGEVRSPGIQRFMVDNVTIIDALSSAGDLTDFGKREDVTVIRQEKGRRIYHKIDLRQKSVFSSPVFALQPNDIVYVGPTKNKLKSLNVDPDVQRRTGLILTFTSLAVSIGTLIITLLR